MTTPQAVRGVVGVILTPEERATLLQMVNHAIRSRHASLKNLEYHQDRHRKALELAAPRLAHLENLARKLEAKP